MAPFMDPTKNFDHLDPKLKETYARVMGTTTNGTGNAAQDSVGQSTTDPAAVSSATNPPQGPADQPQNQFSAGLDQPLSPIQDSNVGPNPGTGPTVSTIPVDTSTMVPPPAQAAQSEPSPDTQAFATSSFFTNPSPATTDPTQNPAQTGTENNLSAPVTPVTEPAQTPVTPYTPENTPTPAIPPMGTAEQFSQPLPSPSTVAQKAPREASALLRVLYIVLAVIFFAIYTVFWIKVFNLPFLF